MGMKRVLSVLLILGMVMTFLTGCANDDANRAQFTSDFRQNGKYYYHGLKYGMSVDEVLKKEKLKKSDLTVSTIGYTAFTAYYLKTAKKQKLYGMDGIVRRTYYFYDNKKYSGSEIMVYFDNERKYLDACKRFGKLLHETLGDPYCVNNNVKYNKKQIWNDFTNPPEFLTWKDYMPANDGSDFEWGNSSKENFLEVCRGPHLNPMEYPNNYDVPKHYFISFYVSKKL